MMKSNKHLTKRQFLKQGLRAVCICGVGSIWSNLLISSSASANVRAGDAQAMRLQAADKNGIRLPRGFRSRIIARSGHPVINNPVINQPDIDHMVGSEVYSWHAAPDGGACFAIKDGGWIYVSNSEVLHLGGVGAVVFDDHGVVVDAYSILSGSNRNCAGGATPWGSWLSCEEVDKGMVWECDPEGHRPARMRPSLGVFTHEAVAVDDTSGLLYLTEDKPDGCLYRFKADRFRNGHPDLDSGVLQVAVSGSGQKPESLHLEPASMSELQWSDVPDPLAMQKATRYQVPSALRFNGGEGIAYSAGSVVFTSKGDKRVWSYNTDSHQLEILYDASDTLTPILTGVDNVTVSQAGDIYVAEDGGDLQIVVLDRHGAIYPIAQLQGHDQSEVTGLAFSPDGRRLYFSSQRGTSGRPEDGITFEISGF
jgi:uncharacterized protein